MTVFMVIRWTVMGNWLISSTEFSKNEIWSNLIYYFFFVQTLHVTIGFFMSMSDVHKSYTLNKFLNISPLSGHFSREAHRSLSPSPSICFEWAHRKEMYLYFSILLRYSWTLKWKKHHDAFPLKDQDLHAFKSSSLKKFHLKWSAKWNGKMRLFSRGNGETLVVSATQKGRRSKTIHQMYKKEEMKRTKCFHIFSSSPFTYLFNHVFYSSIQPADIKLPFIR